MIHIQWYWLVVLLLNFYTAGAIYWDTELADIKEHPINLLGIIGLCCCGSVVYGFMCMWTGLVFLWRKICFYVPLDFYFDFYFTIKYNVSQWDKERLARINSDVSKFKNSGKMSDRVFRSCVRMINKRCNYEYKPESE